MGKGSPPAPPSPTATAAAQGAANKEALVTSANLNAFNINSPYGSTTYERGTVTGIDGEVPISQTTSLTPVGQETFDKQQQAALDLTELAQNRIGQVSTDQFTTAGLPYDPNGYTEPLINKWQGVTAPYDPAGANYAADSAAMRAATNTALQQGNLGIARANQTYGQAANANAYENRFDQNAQNFNQDTANRSYDPNSYGDLNKYRDDVQGAFYNRQASLLEPQFQQQEEAMIQRLADQGIPVGSEAYNDAMGNLKRGQGEQRQRIANDAVLAAGNESQRQLGMEQGLNTQAFNQSAQRAQFGQNTAQAGLGAQNQAFQQRNLANQQQFGIAGNANTIAQQDTLGRTGFEQGLRNAVRSEALGDNQLSNTQELQRIQAEQNLRNTALNERIQERQMPLNEASAFIQGAPALGVPQAPAVPQYNLPAVDVAGLTNNNYNAQVNSYNAQRNSASNTFNTGLGVVGGLVGKCHSDYKADVTDDVESVLATMRKLRVKAWRYKGETTPHISPLAEEWHAATGLGDGRTIHFGDYASLLHKALQELADDVERLKKHAD